MSRFSRCARDAARANSRQKSARHKIVDRKNPSLQKTAHDERGQVLVMAVFTMMLFLGICAFAVDIGYGVLVKRQLQASADAAALAAAQHLGDGTWYSVALNYSSNPGSLNTYTAFTINTPSITARCSTTIAGPPWDIPCDSTDPNVVTVQESATWRTFFAGIVGHPTLNVNVIAAASKGRRPKPYNIAIVLDTTNSMTAQDTYCGKSGRHYLTQLQCAEQAVGIIMAGLDPSIDRVSLFTFPAMEQNSAANDSNCSGQQPTGEPYTFPSATATRMQTMPVNTAWDRNGNPTSSVQTTYQIAAFGNDYVNSYNPNGSPLNSSSTLTKAIQSTRSCPGIQVNTTQNTYFASTIYAAQSALLAEQAANPGTENAMVFLSDGNANAIDNSSFQDMATSSQTSPGPGVNNTSTGVYPNLQGECGQAVTAAKSASAAGTQVFTVAYGASTQSKSGGSAGNQGYCSTDIGAGAYPNITPCQTMQQMSTGWPTDKSNFYSDYYAPGGDAGCEASGPDATITSLSDIAAAIRQKMTKTGLIPPDTP
jgi:Flp pilus assembly protein TadG